jgi:hypothetical protein
MKVTTTPCSQENSGVSTPQERDRLAWRRMNTTLTTKRMPHRPILEFIPIVSVLDSQRIYRRPSKSRQLGSTLLSRVTSHTSSGEP